MDKFIALIERVKNLNFLIVFLRRSVCSNLNKEIYSLSGSICANNEKKLYTIKFNQKRLVTG